jgi:hypothetical protein
VEELTTNQLTSQRQKIEAAGRAPVLGWADNRKVPVDLRSTNVARTFELVRQHMQPRRSILTHGATRWLKTN